VDKNTMDGVKEIEIIVNDFNQTSELLKQFGLQFKSRQENLREEWNLNGSMVTIDTWPGLFPYIEIEGESEDAVNEVCSNLDLSIKNGQHGSVDKVYFEELNISKEDFNAVQTLDFKNFKQQLGI